MSRILILLPHLHYGGAQRVASILAGGWLGQGHDVTLVVLNADRQEVDFPQVKIIDLFDRAPRWTLFHLAGAYRLPALVLRLRRAIVSNRATHVVSFLRATNVQAILACIGLRSVRLVISERNDMSRQRTNTIWDWLARRLYRYADAVTANSNRAITALGATVPRSKLAYAPNPLGARGQGRVKLLHPTILAVGRVVPQKGYDILLRAFAMAGLKDWQLVVLGSGRSQGQMVELCKTLGIARRVLWLDFVSNPFPYYRSAELFVSSSYFEGASNSLLEAMQCGLAPVVTSACDEIVSNERSGLVVPSGDCTALSRALSRLASDAELRERLARGAEDRAADFHISRALPVWNHLAGI